MRDLEQTLARLSAVRADPLAPGAADELRAALGARSNLVVARAAEIVAEWELRDLSLIHISSPAARSVERE